MAAALGRDRGRGAAPVARRRPRAGSGVPEHPPVTIEAPVSAVWPWLVQLGYGRGGFYSYDWLENLVVLLMGTRARYQSVDRIVPELQNIEAGDFILAAPPGLLGGRVTDKARGRVAAIDPGRALVLEGWGAFVLEPIDERRTRLIVRTRSGETGLPALVNAVFVEPAHFVMERKMLLGIKHRAERLT